MILRLMRNEEREERERGASDRYVCRGGEADGTVSQPVSQSTLSFKLVQQTISHLFLLM